MTIKLLQLNILKGQFLDQIIKHVEKEKFDICTFQEVTGGIASYDQKTDVFKKLSNALQMESILAPNFSYKDYPDSYFGNATFYTPSLHLRRSETLRFKPFESVELIEDGDVRWEHYPYSALVLEFMYGDSTFFNINTHGAWSPKAHDTPEKVRQGTILLEYLKKLTQPFILAGDFNLTKDTSIIKNYASLATNITHRVTNTLNPRIHYARNLFPPGIAVDHVFITKEFKLVNCNVLKNEDLSDHLGISYQVEL